MRVCAWILLCSTLTTATVSAQFRISEFMASNTRTLKDEDGAFVDWIEIQNAGPTVANLAGWSLTDSAKDPSKWQFPSTNLSAGSYLVVFASGKDRRTPGRPFHTNFKLDAAGDYLALVPPDRTTPVTVFDPQYPPQFPDVSFGVAMQVTNTTLVATNAVVRLWVPTDSSVDGQWMMSGFNDSGWLAAINGIGYETGLADALEQSYATRVLQSAPAAYWRMNETNGTTAANLGSLGGSANGIYAGRLTPGEDGPRPPQVAGFEPDNHAVLFNGVDSYVAGPIGLFDHVAQFTMAGWIRPTGPQPSRTGLFGQNDNIEFGFIENATIQLWNQFGSITVPYPFPNGEWHHLAATGDGENLTLYFDGKLSATSPCLTADFGASGYPFNIGGGGVFDASGNPFLGEIDEVAVWLRALSESDIRGLLSDTSAAQIDFSPQIATDVRDQMFGKNACVYLRIPFPVENPASVDQLTLRMRYDDGFVAYLNGQEIARKNAPDTLAWNASATARHADALAIQFEEFDVSALTSFLTVGMNVLAIQGLNVDATNADFLLQAELIASSTAAGSSDFRYFLQPTPGSPNGAGVRDLGPMIAQASQTPEVPGTNDNLTITCRVGPTFAPITNVTLNWRVMFGPLNQTRMLDDGLQGDGTGGDGVFGGTIGSQIGGKPTFRAGQMVRWYVTAQDALGRTSRWPLFEGTNSSAAYLGTVVQPDAVTSKLPVIHLFVDPASQSAVDSRNGGRASIYCDGEFYDNIDMHVRGNTTAGYQKKSHTVKFNAEHPFRHPGPGPRLRKLSFMADYPDPALMRQGLTFWLCNLVGAPAPFYVPVRLQLNGEFYQLANQTDFHGEELLSRLGYNPNGALYKAAGTVQPNVFSTGVFEKRTRTWDNNSDYTALATGIAESLSTERRRTNICDLLDLPEVINYLAAARFVHENDDVWANMSLYHDNDGDGLWRIVPFDVNLSWGAMFAEGDFAYYDGIQVTNDVQKSFPLYGSSKALALTSGAWNRIYDVIFTVPETREMFLRRSRTMLDTWIKPPGTPTSQVPVEQHVRQWRDQIVEEAQRDRTKWGWPPEGGQCNFRPGIALTNAVNGLINEFIGKRRQHYYGKHCVTNTALPIGISKNQNAGIPLAQPADATINIGTVEYNPASGNQDEEYIQLQNPNNFAVDVSGWKLSGGITYMLKPGTVMPAGTALYLSPNVKAFRARTTGPRGGQGLYVQGNYRGRLNAWGELLTLADDTGRTVATNSYSGSPSLAQRSLRITEIMYNPAPLPGNTHDPQQFEYLELKNISPDRTLDLTGVRFTNGISFTFTGSAVTSLGPGQTVLVVRNAAAFTARYGTGFSIAGEYAGFLDNAGEVLRLEDAVGEKILEFAYDNHWYPLTDGLGFSLVIVNENAPWDTWGRKESWRASATVSGSPGAADPAAPVIAPILVNEALVNADPPNTESIELFNPTGAAVNVGGWLLTDDFFAPWKYRIPDQTVIPAGGFLVFDAAQFSAPTQGQNGFRLSTGAGAIYTFSTDTATNLTGYYHGFQFGPSAPGMTFGRYVNSLGEEDFVLQSLRTLGATNAPPLVGPVVISEIMYHPVDAVSPSGAEFVELQNLTATNVPLYDPAYPTNTWQLRNAVSYSFPAHVSIPPNGRLLVVGFDPTNTAQLAAFDQAYNVPTNIAVFGPWNGKLNNAGEPLELKQPLTPIVTVTSTNVPYSLVEKIRYENHAPWPASADGLGDSLQCRDPNAYGNDPTNWFAAGVTAGQANQGNLPPSVVIVSPTNNAVLPRSPAIALLATATDPDGTIARVDFYDGTNCITSVDAPPFRFDWTNATSGPHSLSVHAVDNLGATTTSESVVIMVSVPPPSVAWWTPTNGTILPAGSIVALSASPSSEPGGIIAGVDFYVDGARIGQAAGDPYVFNWMAARAGRHTVGAVARDLSGASSTMATATVFVQATQTNLVVVPVGASWKYLDDGSNPGINWLQPGFDDSKWHTGPAQLGYGDGDEATVISYGPNASTKFITYYFRATFVVGSTAGITGLTCRLLRDDGAVVYLNGVEAFRSNMPNGPVGYLTRAASTVSGVAESTFSSTNLSPSLVVAGTNWLAVEVHQDRPDSSDVSFDLELAVQLAPDSDSDGMPDAWEIAHGTDPWADDATADPDHDGLTNLQEYWAGTSPTNAASVLRIESALLLSDGTQALGFPVISNRTYSILFRDDTPSGPWQKLTDILASSTNHLRWATNTVPVNTIRFYRLVTPKQD